MKIILTKDVAGTGRAGDVKEVSDGHARNFLIPKHLALPATSSALAQIQKEQQERQAKVARLQEKFVALKNKIENKTFIIKAKAQKQNLFAAVSKVQIAQAINDKLNLELNPDQIKLSDPIKSLGLHDVEIQFAQNLSSKVKLSVENL